MDKGHLTSTRALAEPKKIEITTRKWVRRDAAWVVIMLVVAGEAMVSKDAPSKMQEKRRNLRDFYAPAYAPLVAACSAACSSS